MSGDERDETAVTIPADAVLLSPGNETTSGLPKPSAPPWEGDSPRAGNERAALLTPATTPRPAVRPESPRVRRGPWESSHNIIKAQRNESRITWSWARTNATTRRTALSSSHRVTQSASHPIKGYISLILLVGCWVGQSEITQALQTGDGTKTFNKPFLITWWNHAVALLLLPPMILQKGSCHASAWIPPEVYAQGFRGTVGPVVILSVVYCVADWVWYIALAHTSVAAGTALFNSSSIFVYILAAIFLGEAVTPRKAGAVVIALAGVCVLSLLGSNGSGGGELWADALVVLAAILYAVYEVAWKRWITQQWGADDAASVNTIVGLIALATVTVLWAGIPLVAALPHWTADGEPIVHESFELPEREQWPALCGGAAGALGFNITLGLALTYLSPVVVSVGCMLTIPVSAVCDYFLHGTTFGAVDAAGAVLIIVGFLALSDDVADAVTQRCGACGDAVDAADRASNGANEGDAETNPHPKRAPSLG